jgi:hypothetical protein
MKLLEIRTAIYDQFHNSSAGPAFFFRAENQDAHAAYYTSMFLIQDTGEALLTHMAEDFSAKPMQAYLEFWGVMQATHIQQDAICELHQAVAQGRPQQGLAWKELRTLRNQCAGHPANRQNGQRTFMGRSFGKYAAIQYECWDARTRKTTYPRVDLRRMINDYDAEATGILDDILLEMKRRWP